MINPNAAAALRKWREENPDAEVKQRTKREIWEANNTRKTAIDLFCCVCMGGEDTPGYRSLVRECSCEKSCPFWHWRPYK